MAFLAVAVVGEAQTTDPFLGSSYFQEVGKPSVEPIAVEPIGSGVTQVAFASEFAAPPATQPAVLPAGSASRPVIDEPFVDLTIESSGGPNKLVGYDQPSGNHTWQILPDGLIFRSFLAGPRESRLGTSLFHNDLTTDQAPAGIGGSEFLWSGTLGGRRGLIRFGDKNRLKPTGVQLDIEGAALVRLNLDQDRDVDASDFRFGVPLTWGDRQTQYEFGYYHLSSHIGDEFLVRNPTFERINYVRDAIKFSVSHFIVPEWRLYGQVGYAFFTAGGAEPWEFQFGAEYSQPGVTSVWGTPFFATNAHLREERDFGGDFSIQTGWLWRGESGSTLRVAFNYTTGDPTIFQFVGGFEEQLGVGLFYDF